MIKPISLKQANEYVDMNITLENFLNHIFGDRSGKVPMVWIYQHYNDRSFYPDVQGFAESELLAVHRSDFVPSMTFREDFCNNIVNEIYWTQNGIVVTVSKPPERERWRKND